MPKGTPKTQGEKLKGKFEKNYGTMKKEFRRGKNKKKSSGKCETCEKCSEKKKK